MKPADFARTQLDSPELSSRLAFLDVVRHAASDNPLARDAGVWTAVRDATLDPSQPEAVRTAATAALEGLAKPPPPRSAPVMQAARQAL